MAEKPIFIWWLSPFKETDLPGEADGPLADLLHDVPGGELGGPGGPGGGHQLHHGGVVGRVAGVRHNEPLAVHQLFRDLARHCKHKGIFIIIPQKIIIMLNDDKKWLKVSATYKLKKIVKGILRFGVTVLDWMLWIEEVMWEVCIFQSQALTWALKPLSSGLIYKKVETLGISRVNSVLILNRVFPKRRLTLTKLYCNPAFIRNASKLQTLLSQAFWQKFYIWHL